MTITETDVRRMEDIMRQAKEKLEQLKEQNAVLVKLAVASEAELVGLRRKYEDLRTWVRGFQS